LPAQDISVDISHFIDGSSRLHTLPSLKSTKFGIKDSELFESSNNCLCKFIFYTGAGCDIQQALMF